MTGRRPGAWPVTEPVDLDVPEEMPSPAAERARFEMVLSSIRCQLGEQPSERCVRAAARRWINAVTAASDAAADKFKQDPG